MVKLAKRDNHLTFSLVDRMLDNAWKGWQLPTSTYTYYNYVWTQDDPALDVRAENGAYVIELDVPGFDEKELTIEFDKDYLTITGKKEKAGRHSSFSKKIYVPGAKVEEAKATLSKGVLRVEFGKEEKAKPKQLEIKVL